MSEPPDDPHPPATRWHRAGHVVRALAVDTRPLRQSPEFRKLWIGEVITMAGTQVTIVALFVQIYQLTGSAAMVGLIGLVEFVPLVFGTIVGGPLVDRHDRRRLLLLTQSGLAISTLVLLATAMLDDPPLWLIYTAAGTAAALSGIDTPTRTAMTPRLVGRELLPSAIALNQVMWNLSVIVGPALGGIVIARLGLPWAYGIDAATYCGAIVLVLSMRRMRPERDESTEGETSWAAIKAGFAYLKGRRVLQSTFAIDLVAMVFGLPEALFPILAVTQFHRGPAVVGLLFSSVAVGALVASLTAGWVGRVRHQGQAVIWAVIVWGAGITGFGLIGDHLWIALLLLAIAGGADVVSAIFRSSILQQSVPDSLRGRLSAVHYLVVSGGPRLGNLEAGLVAAAFTPVIAVVSGGVLTMAGALLIALFVPEFRRYHSGEET
ncbi:MAG: MFS transporter [Actinomycetota bacterium]